MPKLIYERALHVNPVDGSIFSYWPEYWTMNELAKRLVAVSAPIFAASYQNDPSALEGNSLKAEWIQFYLPEELEAARKQYNCNRGIVHAGLDLAAGGDVANNPDYCGGIATELLGHRGYITDILTGRWPVNTQAEMADKWLDTVEPNFTIVEDNTAKGYVYIALTTQINEGRGTRHAFTIEKPQGGNAVGAKPIRFLSMAPRFEAGQVRIPGVMKGDELVCHPRFELLFQQWKSFPSGHDDLLDGLYWSIFSAFGHPVAISVTKSPEGQLNSQSVRPTAVDDLCGSTAHLAYGKPITGCPRCMLNRSQTASYTRGAPLQTEGQPTNEYPAAFESYDPSGRVGVGSERSISRPIGSFRPKNPRYSIWGPRNRR